MTDFVFPPYTALINISTSSGLEQPLTWLAIAALVSLILIICASSAVAIAFIVTGKRHPLRYITLALYILLTMLLALYVPVVMSVIVIAFAIFAPFALYKAWKAYERKTADEETLED